jgi:hypothetical protein
MPEFLEKLAGNRAKNLSQNRQLAPFKESSEVPDMVQMVDSIIEPKKDNYVLGTPAY